MQNGAIDTLVSNEETPESVPLPPNDLLQRPVKSQTSTVVYPSAAELGQASISWDILPNCSITKTGHWVCTGVSPKTKAPGEADKMILNLPRHSFIILIIRSCTTEAAAAPSLSLPGPSGQASRAYPATDSFKKVCSSPALGGAGRGSALWERRCPAALPPGPHLSEVVQGLVQVGVHARGWLAGDLDGVLQEALGDDVALGGGGRLRTHEDPELSVAVLTVLLQLLLQGAEPLGHQVDVLVGRKEPPAPCKPLLKW